MLLRARQHFTTNGGTSASTPLMAGVQLLIDQATQSKWGNPDPIYYALARNQFQPGTIASCDASLGTGAAAACVFHDITAGDNVGALRGRVTELLCAFGQRRSILTVDHELPTGVQGGRGLGFYNRKRQYRCR